MRRADVAVFIHYVWGTWDRLPLLSEALRPRVHRVIGAACQELGAQVIAIGGVDDHVHLLVRQPATVSIADLMQQVKGASSHFINHEIRLDAVFRWQGGYAALSVSYSLVPTVTHYIMSQAEHHAASTTNPEWELGSGPPSAP